MADQYECKNVVNGQNCGGVVRLVDKVMTTTKQATSPDDKLAGDGRTMVEYTFPDRVYLCSKCGQETRQMND